MKRFKKMFLGFLSILFLLIPQYCYAADTSKIINANPNLQNNTCWIDTSKWELRWHSETRYKQELVSHTATGYKWVRDLMPLHRPLEADSETTSCLTWEPAHNEWPSGDYVIGHWANHTKSHIVVAVQQPYSYTYEKLETVPYTYRWQQYDWIPSGFTVDTTSYTAIIDKKQRYIYTQWHKKEDNSPACLDVECKLSDINLNNKPAKVTNLRAYHRVHRYNGAYDTVSPYDNTISQNNLYFKGKLKYPHAGDGKSELHFIADTEAIFPITYFSICSLFIYV